MSPRFSADLVALVRARQSGRSLLEIAQGKAPARRGRASYREFAEQVAFVARLRLDPRTRELPWTASMQGINLPPLQAKLAKQKGVQRGVPDFQLFAWSRRRVYNGLALEFKDPLGNGQPTKEQRIWRAKLEAEGWRYQMPLTSEEAWEMFCDYLELARR